MKNYVNHKFGLIEDDDLTIETSRTDIFCLILSIIAILIVIAGVLFTIAQAKAEVKQYSIEARQELSNLMEFNF